MEQIQLKVTNFRLVSPATSFWKTGRYQTSDTHYTPCHAENVQDTKLDSHSADDGK